MGLANGVPVAMRLIRYISEYLFPDTLTPGDYTLARKYNPSMDHWYMDTHVR